MNTNETITDTDDDFRKLPGVWFKSKYPEVFKKHKDAVELASTKEGVFSVRAINEDFLADTIGHLGNPKSPTVYVSREERFYRYDPKSGIFMPVSENQILADLSTLIHECAQVCQKKGFCDTTSLSFQLSKAGQLSGVIKKAKGLLHVSEDYFDSNIEEYISCSNGMLRLLDMELIPFNADFRRRNKLSVPYETNAKCPMFLDTLIHPESITSTINCEINKQVFFMV